MKILFVINEIGFADHIAISYLSAIAKQLGHLTYICILTDNDLFFMIKKINPDIVAYSVNVIGYKNIIKQHKIAKKKNNFISIMGGPQATFSPETFYESGMDAYCIGEGEYVFRDFLNKVNRGKDYYDIPNLITKKGENEVRPLIENLGEIPVADRDLTISNSFLKNISKKTFYATRGCYYNCSYCCNSYYHKLYKNKGPMTRRFPVERIICEIEDVKSKYRTDFIKFGDDIFALKADKWMEDFVNEYSKRIKIPFNCFLRLDSVNDNLLALLKEAGCYSVHLSVDSVSYYVREEILNRKMKKINIEEILKKIKKYKINTWVNFMLAAPCSTLQDDLGAIYMSKKSKITYSQYSTTVPINKTALYDYCIKNKIIDSDYKGDMGKTIKKSELSCFTEKDKNIRYNIKLLGAIVSKLPFPFYYFGIWVIKNIPPNKLFLKLKQIYYNYVITHTIFKIKKDK